MKANRKFTFSILLIISAFVIFCQCKPAGKQEEASAKIIVTVDSEKIIVVSGADTVIPQIPLTLIVNNLASSTAPVIVGVYRSQRKFLYKEGRLKEYKFIPKGNTLTADITDLSYGEYALAVYQDINSTGKFDKNLIGIPKEPYAFSKNFIPKSKAPAYDDCKFEYDSINNTVTINLIK